MNLEKEIDILKARNARVEADKAWEVSWTRAGFIALLTYLVAGIWLVMISDTHPWKKALVPAVGYLFSTFSLPIMKQWWILKQER